MNTSEKTPVPTLARLCFQVPPDRMAEFEARYEQEVAPILKAHGLMESSERARPTVEGLFSRLIGVQTPTEVSGKCDALQEDPKWQDVLRDLGLSFGNAGPDGLIHNSFDLYVSPAGPGKELSGVHRTGFWRTYDATDGLVSGFVMSMLQDRDGNLWFGVFGGGVSRYDGQTFTNFTTRDGLAHNEVSAVFQDRDGHMWFGTEAGVSRYDGQAFTSLTKVDGLASNQVSAVFQDHDGHFWFGTESGVSRYNGRIFTTFTTQDGLADNWVRSIFRDEDGNLWFGTNDGGVSRYDGQSFLSFTEEDGLAGNGVMSIFQDRDRNLWFGTFTGVSR